MRPSDRALAAMRTSHTGESGIHASISEPLPEASRAAVSALSWATTSVREHASSRASYSAAIALTGRAIAVSATTVSSMGASQTGPAANQAFSEPLAQAVPAPPTRATPTTPAAIIMTTRRWWRRDCSRSARSLRRLT